MPSYISMSQCQQAFYAAAQAQTTERCAKRAAAIRSKATEPRSGRRVRLWVSQPQGQLAANLGCPDAAGTPRQREEAARDH